jgi:hypothetical protein
MLDVVVKFTNEKIEEDFILKAYTEDTLKKSPHICYTDEVNLQ